MGVNIDETDFDVAGNVIRASDCIIGSNDIDSDRGKWFRDVFYGLNKYTSTPWIGLDNLTIPSNGYTTILTHKTYQHMILLVLLITEVDYINFRGTLMVRQHLVKLKLILFLFWSRARKQLSIK
jgi:hypothetical protein